MTDNTINKDAALFDMSDFGDIGEVFSPEDLPTQRLPEGLEKEQLQPQEQLQPEQQPQPVKKPKAPVKKKPLIPSEELSPEQKELVEKSPEAKVLREYTPYIFKDAFYAESNPIHVDSSVSVLAYLLSMGYKKAIFVLGPEWTYDNCKNDLNDDPVCLKYSMGNNLPVEGIINNAIKHASDHGYSPEKALVALTHPGCKCNLYIVPPVSYKDIPDNAPGLPMFADRKELLDYKKELHPKLSPVDVDRWSALSDVVFNDPSIDIISRIAASKEERQKKAAIEWEDNLQPVAIKKSFLYSPTDKIIRPVPNIYMGYQTQVGDKYSKVFLSGLNYIIDVPQEHVAALKLKQIPRPTDYNYNNTFVLIDGDTFGIFLMEVGGDKAMCYIPEFGTTAIVDDFQFLETV